MCPEGIRKSQEAPTLPVCVPPVDTRWGTCLTTVQTLLERIFQKLTQPPWCGVDDLHTILHVSCPLRLGLRTRHTCPASDHSRPTPNKSHSWGSLGHFPRVDNPSVYQLLNFRSQKRYHHHVSRFTFASTFCVTNSPHLRPVVSTTSASQRVSLCPILCG